MDYQNINQKIVIKPYPLHRMGETIQQLEGFQYATPLDPNMGYYNIDLLTESGNLTTIVTGFWKFRYNRFPRGLYASGEIFQSKVDELLGDIKGVKTYINDIILLGKGSSTQHIYHLRVIFDRLFASVIRVNNTK